jgi:hypothetical protein
VPVLEPGNTCGISWARQNGYTVWEKGCDEVQSLVKRHGLSILFAAAGFALTLYATRPRRVEVLRGGHISYILTPQPALFVIKWIVLGTLVCALWGEVFASLMASENRLRLLRRYWPAWALGLLALIPALERAAVLGPATLEIGVNAAILAASAGIAATWLYNRYLARRHPAAR